MKMKLLIAAMGMLVGMNAFAVPTLGMYWAGYMGMGRIYIPSEKLKKPQNSPLGQYMSQLEPNVTYIFSCVFNSKIDQFTTDVPISFHWKNVDTNNLIYYIQGQKVNPKQENGKDYISVFGPDGYIEIHNVMRTGNTHPDVDIDSLKYSLSYFCYAVKDA